MKARIPGGAGGTNNMMKKIQEMQEEMERMQAEVEASEFTASSGGGAVEAVVMGTHEIKSIKISPEVVDPEDIEMLEDMICAACNEAISKATDAMDQSMEKAKTGLSGLGGGLGGLF